MMNSVSDGIERFRRECLVVGFVVVTIGEINWKFLWDVILGLLGG